MLELAIAMYCIYFAINFYTTFMQIDYVQRAKNKDAVILSASNYIEAGNYSIQSQKIALMTTFYDFILFFIWIFFGLQFLDEMTSSYTGWIKTVIFIDSFIVINWFLALPFDLYSTFKLNKKFGFSNMTIKLYIQDVIKTALIFLIIGSSVIAGLSFIIESFDLWWIWGFIFIFTVIVLINMLYPVFRAKMFDKFSPLEDKELEEKINKLLDTVGFKSSGVFSVDASKRDNRLNAYFGGLGATKRVVLFDTLVQKLSHNELLAVLGHELGHFKNGDILKNIAMMGMIIFTFFVIFGNLPNELFTSLQLNNEPYAILIILMMFSPIISFFIMPLMSAMSRHNEYAADEFGSNLATKDDLVNALLKLANENKSFPLSHPLYIFFYYSHPPLVQRLKELGYNGAGIKQMDDSDSLQGDFINE
jgi:STE24 endopeptidase